MADKNWKASYNAEDNSELRRLQMAELENMRVFSDICKKNGLRFFLIGGTMLGAIRHHGFIPWDDDMDVGMPRSDYEKFLEIARKELPKGFGLLNYKKQKGYLRYFSRVINKQVVVTNASNTKTIDEYAWLDIFPFDGMPQNIIIQKKHLLSLTVSRFFYHASCFDELVNLNRPGRAWYLQAIIRFLSIAHIGRKINTRKQMKKIERKLKKYDYDKSEYVINLFGAYVSKEVLSKKVIGKMPHYSFEDLFLPGPEKYDQYLTHFYGDYMMPPKDIEKDKHNINSISFKNDN